jgi:hypothetical protein
MAKKNKARVPKHVAGVKIPKRWRRAARPLARLLDSPFGSNVTADVLIALAIAFASTEAMRESFKKAAKRAKKGGGNVSDLVLHLGRAAVLPALVALHAKLPDDAQAELRRQQRAQHTPRAAEAMH